MVRLVRGPHIVVQLEPAAVHRVYQRVGGQSCNGVGLQRVPRVLATGDDQSAAPYQKETAAAIGSERLRVCLPAPFTRSSTIIALSFGFERSLQVRSDPNVSHEV